MRAVTNQNGEEAEHRGEQGTAHTVLCICDFFFPRMGGVEMHLWSLSQCLLGLGHRVIMLTHAHGSRKGVRYMANGLKVYYAPLVAPLDGSCIPTLCAFYPLLRHILLREQVTIVHGHSATSLMAEEAMLMAKTMGYKVVYTDHSLFGFDDAASIHLNKACKFTFCHVDHAICVSNTCRENLVLRACVAPEKISVIPNAIDQARFLPDPGARQPQGTTNIVIMSRLVYRKGIDLVVPVIVAVCRRFPHVHFIVGGDGPKRLLLDEMVEKHQLHNRVELLGAVSHADVRGVLVRGHIFLNCSLTESFCIAILEAVSCGLFVVSTRVGGVPEVLPGSMVLLAEPRPTDLVEAVARAMKICKTVVPESLHDQVRDMYSWQDVALRTEKVYNAVSLAQGTGLVQRIHRFRRVGVFGQIVSAVIATAVHLLWLVLERISPAADVELAPLYPYAK